MRTVLEKQAESVRRNCREKQFGEKIGLLAKLFGCWHKHLSRPFTHGRHSYIVCLDCGARKHFDTETMRSYGKFHFPPEIRRVTGESS